MHQPARRVASLALALSFVAAAAAIPGLGARAESPRSRVVRTSLGTSRSAAEPAVLRTPALPAEVAAFADEAGLRREVLAQALAAASEARREGLSRSSLLTVVDYTLPSTEKRLWVLDVAKRKVLFHELVAHGKNSGDNYPTAFSNTNESLQSSVGLFRTASTYQGKNGYSLKLEGLEPGFNDLALPRTIVVHGAWYVSDAFAREHGRLGRSWGCPAVPQAAAKPIIDTIKGGSLLFAYYPQKSWLEGSRFLRAARVAGAGGPAAATAVAGP